MATGGISAIGICLFVRNGLLICYGYCRNGKNPLPLHQFLNLLTLIPNNMRKKLLTILALLCLTVTSAWADNYTSFSGGEVLKPGDTFTVP